MKTMRLMLVAAALAAASALPAQDTPTGGTPTRPRADDPPTRQGTRGANFLEIGVGARANAMAGAFASVAEGPVAMYWNPAGLAATEQLALSATRQNLYEDMGIHQTFAALSLPFLGGVVGASVNSLTSGDIPRATERDPEGDPVFGRTFEWSSLAIGASYGRRLTDRLDVGFTAKYITEGLPDASLTWFGLDVGTKFRTGIYGTTIGATLQNVGPSATVKGAAIRRTVESDEFSSQLTRVNFQVQETELPTLFRFSVGTDIFGGVESLIRGNGGHALVSDVSFMDAIDTDLQIAGGLEYSFANIVFLRGGKRWYNDDRETGEELRYGLSGGVGVRVPVRGRALRFDYSYTSLGELQNVQAFTFEFGQ